MVRLGRLDLGEGMHTPKSAMTLNEKLIQLRQQVKVQEKRNTASKKENDFLEGCSVSQCNTSNYVRGKVWVKVWILLIEKRANLKIYMKIFSLKFTNTMIAKK